MQDFLGDEWPPTEFRIRWKERFSDENYSAWVRSLGKRNKISNIRPDLCLNCKRWTSSERVQICRCKYLKGAKTSVTRLDIIKGIRTIDEMEAKLQPMESKGKLWVANITSSLPCGGLWGERTLHTKFKSNLQASADGIFQAKIPPKMFTEILNASITHGHVLTE